MSLPPLENSAGTPRREVFIPDPNLNALHTEVDSESARPAATDPKPVTPDHGDRKQAQADRLPEPAEMLLAQLNSDNSTEQKRFRRLLVIATIAHLALFFVVFPEIHRETQFVGTPGKVYVMQQTRFKKPPPRAEKQEQKVPKKKAKKIPIPDPTPDDPEPIELASIDIPELEEADIEDAVFGIPDGPDPGTGIIYGGAFEGDALQVGDGVAKPIAISKPQPYYTEEARQARIQGVVILSLIVTEEGDVANLKVLKGLPLGLDKSALETVAMWKFKPAKDLQGKAVPVYFNITVSFWLQ